MRKDIFEAVFQMLPHNSGGNQKSDTYPNTESTNFSVHHNKIDSFYSKLDLCTILQFHLANHSRKIRTDIQLNSYFGK